MTVWGNVLKSPVAWMFVPLRWAEEVHVDNQSQWSRSDDPGSSDAMSGRVIVWLGDARCNDGQHLDGDSWNPLE
jgi:hypothetical protein